MDIFELLQEAGGMLMRNAMRTTLAILGIVIGIGSVIALVSLGQGSQRAVETQIEALGSNLLTISPGSANSGPVRGGSGSATTLTNEDAEALKKNADTLYISAVSPEFSSRTQVTAGRNNTNTTILGVESAYAGIRKVEVQSGAFISERDAQIGSKVAVLGPGVANTLFGENADPVGQTIRVKNQVLQIIGVTVSKGGTGFMNQDDMIYVPLPTAQKQLFGKEYVTNIGVEVIDKESMASAQDAIGYFLLERHGMSNPTEADFSIISQNDILSTATSMTSTFTTLLSGIAGISLLVGGIGIMNIMLVTVTERTREIGLRKALGAKRRAIIMQFLIESVLLTVVGGCMGALLGVGASFLMAKMFSFAFVISIPTMGIAVVVSAGIGIIFGWYPARKASLLQPIEALRYE